MADWLGSRRGRFVYRKVDWDTWQDGAEYGNATGGSLELSALSALKASGSLKFEGTPPEADCPLRIYYEFEDDQGDSELLPLATMVVEVSSVTYGDGGSAYGSATLESPLAILQDKDYGAPFTVSAGTEVIGKAVELIKSLGLRVHIGTGSLYELKSEKTFGTDECDYLTIVNWLLDKAGCSSAWVDAFGTVQISTYVEPASRATVFTFEPGQRSVMLPELPYSNDWRQTPNVVRLHYGTETESIVAWASNLDPDHPASLVRRGGREKTLAEDVDELAGDTADERVLSLMDKATAMLVDNSSEIDYVTVGCPLLPLSPNDAVEVRFAVLDWRGCITNYAIDLGKCGAGCKVKARRIVSRDLVTQTGGRVVWSIEAVEEEETEQ